MFQPYHKIANEERGASLIEVMLVALIILIAGSGLAIMLERGLADNTQQSMLNNNAFANFASLFNGTTTQTTTVMVTVTALSASNQEPVSVAMSSPAKENVDATYQTE